MVTLDDGPLRIGILGAARITTASLVDPARNLGTRLAGVAARNRSRAEEFARLHDIEGIFGTYEELIASAEVEAIYNPLVNSEHAYWNLAAIRAGKHVLSEKPFAANAFEAAFVRDAAQAAGVHVVDGFHYIHHPVTRRLVQLLESKRLGEIRTVEVTMCFPAPEPDDPRWSFELAGGALMDAGSYSLHANRLVGNAGAGGEPRVVAARSEPRAGLEGVDERTEVTLEFPNGATGIARCDMDSEGRDTRIIVTGSHGSATVMSFVTPDVDDRIIVEIGGERTVEHWGRITSYTYQLQAFTRLLRQGRPMSDDCHDAVKTMLLIDEAYAAAGLPRREGSHDLGTTRTSAS